MIQILEGQALIDLTQFIINQGSRVQGAVSAEEDVCVHAAVVSAKRSLWEEIHEGTVIKNKGL